MDKPCSKDINFVRCMKCKKIFQCSRHDTAVLLEHIRTDHPETYREHQSKSKSNTKTHTRGTSVDLKSCFCSKSPTKTSKNNQELDSDTDDIESQSYCNDGRGESRIEREEECGTAKPHLAKDIDLTQYSITSDILEKYPEIQNCEYCPEDPSANRVHKRRYKVTSSIGSMRSPQKRNLYRASIEKWSPADGTIFCPKCGYNKRPLIRTRTERISSNQCGACCLLSCWPFCFLPCLLPDQNTEYLHCSKCENFLGLYDRNKNCIKPNRLFVNDEQLCQDKAVGDGTVNSNISINSECESQRLPSIVIDGKELPPDKVARLQKYKKLGSLAGIDFDAYTDKETPKTPKCDDSFKVTDKAPCVEKNRKDYA